VRRLVILAALVAVALGASACTTSPTVATVGGASISKSTLDTQLAALVDNTDAACVFSAEFGLGSSAIAGAGQGTVTTQVATAELDNLILGKLLSETLARHHRVVSAGDLASAKSDLTADVRASLSNASQTGAVPPSCSAVTSNPVAGLPADFGAQLDRFLAVQEQFESLVGHVNVSSAGVARYYRQHPADYRQACLDVVVADTQGAAQKIRTAIAGGESFASAATGAGADTQATPTGGQLPCELQTDLASTFGASGASAIEAAKPGQLLAPLALTEPSTGTTYWLVLKLTSDTEASLSSVASSIRQQLLASAATPAQNALERLIQRSPITVDPRYGNWRGKIGLQPPTPPARAAVLNPTADESAAVVHLGTPASAGFAASTGLRSAEPEAT